MNEHFVHWIMTASHAIANILKDCNSMVFVAVCDAETHTEESRQFGGYAQGHLSRIAFDVTVNVGIIVWCRVALCTGRLATVVALMALRMGSQAPLVVPTSDDEGGPTLQMSRHGGDQTRS